MIEKSSSNIEKAILEAFGIETFVEVIRRSKKQEKQTIKVVNIQFTSNRSLVTFLSDFIGYADFSVKGQEVKFKFTL